MKNLPNMVVQIRPIEREGQWLPKGHDGNIQFSGTKTRVVVPMDSKTGGLVDPLNDDERGYVEKVLGLKEGDLNIYKKVDNFWHKYDFYLDKGGCTLNIKDSIKDFLIYKVALVNNDLIAPSWSERNHKGGTRKWAIVNMEEEEIEKTGKVYFKIEAYEKLKEFKKSNIKCYEFLLVYNNRTTTTVYSLVPKGKTIEYYLNKIEEIINKNPKDFLDVVNLPEYQSIVLIQKGIATDVLIQKSGKVGFKGEQVIGNYNKAIEYFNDEKNSEDKQRLIALIEDKLK